jgi:AcrR family transcriptional regulator
MVDTHNSTDSGPTPKKPTQLRSRQIVKAIMQACRKIMKEQGPEALNTNYIAEVAGVNIASLYRWFPNKNVIIAETFEEQVAEEISELLRIYEQHTSQPATSLREALSALLINPLISRQIRFLSMHACFYQQHQPAFDVGKRKYEGRDDSLIEEAGQWLAQALQQRRPELTDNDCQWKAFFVARTIESLCLKAATDRPEWLRDEAFSEEILKLVMPYLEA